MINLPLRHARALVELIKAYRLVSAACETCLTVEQEAAAEALEDECEAAEKRLRSSQ